MVISAPYTWLGHSGSYRNSFAGSPCCRRIKVILLTAIKDEIFYSILSSTDLVGSSAYKSAVTSNSYSLSQWLLANGSPNSPLCSQQNAFTGLSWLPQCRGIRSLDLLLVELLSDRSGVCLLLLFLNVCRSWIKYVCDWYIKCEVDSSRSFLDPFSHSVHVIPLSVQRVPLKE